MGGIIQDLLVKFIMINAKPHRTQSNNDANSLQLLRVLHAPKFCVCQQQRGANTPCKLAEAGAIVTFSMKVSTSNSGFCTT
jgi:hypothetical protein